MTKLINLTRNTITVYASHGNEVLFDLPTDTPSVQADVWAKERFELLDDVTGRAVPVVKRVFNADEDLIPAPAPDVVYVVGYAVLQALGGSRSDCVAPDTGRESVVRDGSGRIVGVRRFRVL